MTAHQSDATVTAVARSLAETFAKAAGWLDDMGPDARRALIGGGVGATVGGLGGLVSGAGGAGAKKRPLHNFLLGAGLGAGVGGTAGYIGSRVLDPKPDRGVPKDLGGWTPELIKKFRDVYQDAVQSGDKATADKLALTVFPNLSVADARKAVEDRLSGHSLNVDAETPIRAGLGTGYRWGSEILGSVLDKKVGVPTVAALGLADAFGTFLRPAFMLRPRSNASIATAMKELGVHGSVSPQHVRKLLNKAGPSDSAVIRLLMNSKRPGAVPSMGSISRALLETEMSKARQALLKDAPARGFAGFPVDGKKILQRRYVYPLGIFGAHLASSVTESNNENRRQADELLRVMPTQQLRK